MVIQTRPHHRCEEGGRNKREPQVFHRSVDSHLPGERGAGRAALWLLGPTPARTSGHSSGRRKPWMRVEVAVCPGKSQALGRRGMA